MARYNLPHLGTCVDCGATFETRSAIQRYCSPCGLKHRHISANRWAHAHPPTKEKVAQMVDRSAARQIARGIAVNEAQRRTISWTGDPGPDCLWKLTVAMPFSWGISKNARHWLEGHKRILQGEARLIQEEIVVRFKNALQNTEHHRIVQAKLWIDLLVQKPQHRGDAVNVVDSVCDALVIATGLDDRWYSIRRLDWEIVKDEPMLFISISQETDIDHQSCSRCGRILPFSHFGPRKDTKNGIGRVCLGCRTGKDAPWPEQE